MKVIRFYLSIILSIVIFYKYDTVLLLVHANRHKKLPRTFITFVLIRKKKTSNVQYTPLFLSSKNYIYYIICIPK